MPACLSIHPSRHISFRCFKEDKSDWHFENQTGQPMPYPIYRRHLICSIKTFSDASEFGSIVKKKQQGTDSLTHVNSSATALILPYVP